MPWGGSLCACTVLPSLCAVCLTTQCTCSGMPWKVWWSSPISRICFMSWIDWWGRSHLGRWSFGLFQKRGVHLAVADLRGRERLPPGQIFHFHVVFEKNWSNSMLAHPALGNGNAGYATVLVILQTGCTSGLFQNEVCLFIQFLEMLDFLDWICTSLSLSFSLYDSVSKAKPINSIHVHTWSAISFILRFNYIFSPDHGINESQVRQSSKKVTPEESKFKEIYTCGIQSSKKFTPVEFNVPGYWTKKDRNVLC